MVMVQKHLINVLNVILNGRTKKGTLTMEKTNQDFHDQAETIIEYLKDCEWTIHESVLILQIALDSARQKHLKVREGSSNG